MMATANNWYWLSGTSYCPDCVECDAPAIDANDATRGHGAGNCGCCGRSASGRGYSLAFMLESTGDFEIVQTFVAADDAAANAWAEQHYPGQQWYVLDADGENING